MTTAIHRRVAALRTGADPTIIARLGSGWAVMGDPQVLRGYSLLLPDPVVPHLNAMPTAHREAFLADMARLGDAVLAATGAVRINYALFGNLEPALHAHVLPRFADEPAGHVTAHPWSYDWAQAARFDPGAHGALRGRIGECLAAQGGDISRTTRDTGATRTGRVDHVDLTVSDLVRSTRFYAEVLDLIGFAREPDCAEGPLFRGQRFELGLQQARAGRHDRFSPGLHHLAFAAPDRSAVDRLHVELVARELEVLDAPADYPDYEPGYYAVFFADPDGVKLEYAHRPAWDAQAGGP